MIKDTGKRREFETGAVRDIDAEKGRCDLMPLGVLYEIVVNCVDSGDGFLSRVHYFVDDGKASYLILAADELIEQIYGKDKKNVWTAFLDLSIHFRDGAEKYGERNWEKGIPVHSYIDSAVRHYIKWKRGDDDEPHARAALWNIVCAAWTVENMPEMDDVPHRNWRT